MLELAVFDARNVQLQHRSAGSLLGRGRTRDGPRLSAFFQYAVTDVGARNTPDPANVSKPIKLKIDRDIMVERLKAARDLVDRSLANDADETVVRATLADLFWKHLESPEGTDSKSAIASKLRQGNAGVRMGAGLTIGGAGGTALKDGRAYGGEAREARWEIPRWALVRRGSEPPEVRARTARQIPGSDGADRLSWVKKGRRYTVTLDVPHYSSRRIEIWFSSDLPPRAVVTADGPTSSPHRYNEHQLCMWYPSDPLENRWVLRDGLWCLLGMTAAHLFREAWWRETGQGEWLGPEVTHDRTKILTNLAEM